MSASQKPWFTQLKHPDENSLKYPLAECSMSSSRDAKSLEDKAGETAEQESSERDSSEQDDTQGGKRTTLYDDTLGLALSGGGIRSATFSLGVIQALARNGWLNRIDLLSTVSGGGYTGTFLGRFFDNTRAGEGLAGPEGDPEGAAQERVARELSNSRSLPISWIRKHANYLAPIGVGEQLFNFSTYWRNLLSLLLVLAFFFLALFGISSGLLYNHYGERWLGYVFAILNSISPISSVVPEWVSGFWIRLVELSLWLGVVPLVFAYWLGSQDRHRTFVITYFFALLLFALGLLFAFGQPVTLVVFASAIGWTYLSWIAVAQDQGLANPESQWRMALGRNYITYRLVDASSVLATLLALTLIDSAGIWLAESLIRHTLDWDTFIAWIGSAMAAAIAATPVVRTLTWYLAAEGSESKGILSAFLRIPYLPTLGVVLVGIILPLSLVAMVVHLAYSLGANYLAGAVMTFVALLISILLGTSEALPFVNRSGPLTIYSARLARVFLGAVNRGRLRHLEGADVSHVIEGDDTPFYKYRPHEAGGPLHFINVAVNETFDVISRRGVNARQSENLAVGPAGLSVSKQWHALWEADPNDKAPALKALSDHTSVHPLEQRSGEPVKTESLSLRQWMSISGAAFSPGQGRSTSLARALILTMANLRLGYWWDSGLGVASLAKAPFRNGRWIKLKRLFSRVFQGQALLISELRGRFGGPWRRFWYLSDGGHFEYSGAYELLRRRVPFIIICDAGADKARSGEIMADLTRIARIDWGAEISDLSFPENGEDNCRYEQLCELGVPEKLVQKLGSLDDLLSSEAGTTKKHAALLRVNYVGEDDRDSWHGRKHSWILYLKASVNGDEPIDILTYREAHKDFPNESTLDQFFDEQQFESYRALGEHIGSEVFLPGGEE